MASNNWALLVAGSSGYYNYRHQVQCVYVSVVTCSRSVYRVAKRRPCTFWLCADICQQGIHIYIRICQLQRVSTTSACTSSVSAAVNGTITATSVRKFLKVRRNV